MKERWQSVTELLELQEQVEKLQAENMRLRNALGALVYDATKLAERSRETAAAASWYPFRECK